jgi:hypothetical protein
MPGKIGGMAAGDRGRRVASGDLGGVPSAKKKEKASLPDFVPKWGRYRLALDKYTTDLYWCEKR